ncbi:TonB-dependent receptor domain-containing protein [Ferruginibacter sp.]
MKKYIPIKYLLSFILLFGFAHQSRAQNGTGKLTGKITDSTTNLSMNGVSITVMGSAKGVASITDGSYILSLAPGNYTITYSSSSYTAQNISGVVIKKGEVTYLDVLMTPKSDLAGVVVKSVATKRADNQAAMYIKQKSNAAAMDVMSAEVIRRTPDANVGAIIKRMPAANVQDGRFVVVRGLGDQYNQTMLNGVLMTSTETNRNAFALDLIPAAVLDNIAVTKTATPDMPGNFAGGIVQINTKEFPASDFYSITVGTGFSSQTIGKTFYGDSRSKFEMLGFGAKNKQLPAEYPKYADGQGGVLGYNFFEQQRFLRMLKNNLKRVDFGGSKPNESLQFGYGKTIKFKNAAQLGIVAAVSQRKTELIEDELIMRSPQIFNTDPPGTPFGVNYYSENKRYRYNADFGGVVNFALSFGKNKITFKNLITQIYNSTFTERPFGRITERISQDNANNEKAFYGVTYFTEQKKILNSILSGEHRTGINDETRIEWNINTTLNSTDLPDIRNFFLPKISGDSLFAGTNLSDASKALQQQGRNWTKSNDKIIGGAFNITTPIMLLKNKQIFKTGILFQSRYKKTTSDLVIYQNLNDELENLLAAEHFYLNQASFSALGDIAISTGTYNAGSNLFAAYESIDSKIGKKLRVIWGIRAEKYDQFVDLYNQFTYPNFNTPDLSLNGNITARTVFNFLPSVNMVYAATKKINLRLAYSKTVIRPDLRDLAQFARVDLQTYVLSAGNAALKSTSINNYDFKAEYFPGSGEIFAVSAFYKKLDNAIEYALSPGSSPSLLVPINVSKVYVRGVEAEIRKKMDFLPFAEWLKNITLFGNGTLLKSKVPTQLTTDPYVPNITVEHTLIGQAKYIINAGITISAFKNSFEATITYNKTGDHIYQLNDIAENPSLGPANLIPFPIFINPRDMMDISLSQNLFKDKCKLKLNITNLLKSRYIAYQDINSNAKFDEPLKIDTKAMDISIPSAYISGIDNTTSDIKPQRTYSFSITYNF